MSVGRTRDKVWLRLERKMINIVEKLRAKHKFFTIQVEEIMSEVQWKFVSLFYEKYEDDNQYLRFMFIVSKNVIHDMQRKEYRYTNKHSCDLTKLRNKFRIPLQGNNNVDDEYLRIINEMAVDNKFENSQVETLIFKELKEQVETRLENPIHIKIFRLILDEYKPLQISEEINKPTAYVGQVKRHKIFPVVKEVLEMSDEDYEWHSASGRIFCKE